MTKNIYLTIDDAPSKHLLEKIDYLTLHHIPAVFYCRGEFMERHFEKVVAAIQKSFLIGNHSYTHPHFSAISLEQCVMEIEKTEALIDACYQQAGKKRPVKVIRLPFADRGAGDEAQIPTTPEAQEKCDHIQHILSQFNFETLIFPGVKWDHLYWQDPAIDSFWTQDPSDYKKKYYENPKAYLENFKQVYEQSTASHQVLLLHDFDYNHEIFILAMDFLREKKCTFHFPHY